MIVILSTSNIMQTSQLRIQTLGFAGNAWAKHIVSLLNESTDQAFTADSWRSIFQSSFEIKFIVSRAVFLNLFLPSTHLRAHETVATH